MSVYDSMPWVSSQFFRISNHKVNCYIGLEYKNLEALKRPQDPSMTNTDCSLFTWMLKLAGVIKSDFTEKGDRWETSKTTYETSKVQELNDSEWDTYKGEMLALGNKVLEKANAVLCTPLELCLDMAKGVHWALGVIDEGTNLTEAESLMVCRASDNILIFGDLKQQRPSTFASEAENPFGLQLKMSMFERLYKGSRPFHTLKEIMRATTGLEQLTSDLFYDSQLVSGPRTELDHASRAMAVKWREYISKRYPSLKNAPQGLTYPMLVNVVGGLSQAEIDGTSRFNLAFIAAAIQEIKAAFNAGVEMFSDVGICTLYSAQVAKYKETFRKMGSGWVNIRVGNVEYWKGREVAFLVSDAVRAGNDEGKMGFLKESGRINVWLSRQVYVHVVIGDDTCTRVPEGDPDWAILNKKNTHIIRMFQ